MLTAMLLCAIAGGVPQDAPEPRPDTFTLAGRVVDLEGGGVPVAEVWVTHWTTPDERLARSFTDAEGYFRISRVPKLESWTIWATADGLSVASGFARSASDVVTIEIHDATTVCGGCPSRR